MKAKAMKSGGVLTQTQVIASVAETNGLKNNQVKDVVDALFGVACAEIKKNGNFKLAGVLNLNLKRRPAKPAKKGINPLTKEPCVSKGKFDRGGLQCDEQFDLSDDKKTIEEKFVVLLCLHKLIDELTMEMNKNSRETPDHLE